MTIDRGGADRQEAREAAAREAAMGRRARVISEGHLGPVLKRWINGSVAPIAALLRKVAIAYIEGDMGEVAVLLDTPTAELNARERPLAAILEWSLKGTSPGRSAGEQGTYADDMVLSFLASVVMRAAKADEDKPCTVAYALAIGADALRDTVQGQFITGVQGAKAMQAIRERQPEAWQQKKSLGRICARLASQVKPALEREGGDSRVRTVGHRKVLEVVDHKGDLRMVSLREPDALAWEVMSLCWKDEGSAETSTYRGAWLGLAGMLLAACQREAGWFDITEHSKGRGGHKRTSKVLVLSEEAHARVAKDVDRWVGLGFHAEPMVVPPVDGDYLTVKHRKVTGQRAPLGLTTDPQETTPWMTGACALADTPWTVNAHALGSPESVGGEVSLAASTSPNDALRLAEHRRLASEASVYLPVTMDFRGRIYYRPTWVTPQSGDLGKSLLCFPPKGCAPLGIGPEADALAMHLAGLFSGPSKLDKAPLGLRKAWLANGDWLDFDRQAADKPLTLAAHGELLRNGEWDRIPIQLDGTCNGLQHLAALFRDEEAARHVNLCASSLEDTPADIYGHVADLARPGLLDLRNVPIEERTWRLRLAGAGINPDRSLCKGPVMVLPYGGTREAVRLSVKASLLERLVAWEEPPPAGTQPVDPWRTYEGENYGAFRERRLSEHPLFNQDAGQLSGLIWDSIAPAIPKPMRAMSTLQAIGSWVGDRGLSWRVGVGAEERRLWVTQAKSMGQRKQVTMKGFHLPDLVRRLTLTAHSNEVDPKAHRTGIVANFIHSQDAAHLAHSVAMFRGRGGGCVGAVHDCVMVRPSEARLMGECLRDAFVALYEEDPLSQPVRLWRDKDTLDREFPSWYALAQEAGVEFPERGTFDITEVRQSAWFFS